LEEGNQEGASTKKFINLDPKIWHKKNGIN